MTVSETLQHDMASSMKAGDRTRTGVIRLLRSAIQNEAIKVGHQLGDDEAMKVLQQQAKQRRDSIEQYQTASRQDLIDIEHGELTVIQGYLPQAMSADELDALVTSVITDMGATGMQQMGAVIGAVMKQVGAKADGGAVSSAVKAKLAN